MGTVVHKSVEHPKSTGNTKCYPPAHSSTKWSNYNEMLEYEMEIPPTSDFLACITSYSHLPNKHTPEINITLWKIL